MPRLSKETVINIKIWKYEMTFKNVPYKLGLLLVTALLILAMGIAYSFIKGWSTIKVQKKPPKQGSTLKIDDMEQDVAPGTPVTIKKDGKKIEIRKGHSE